MPYEMNLLKKAENFTILHGKKYFCWNTLPLYLYILIFVLVNMAQMIPTIQPSQQIQLKYIFGMNSSIRNNIYFIDDQRLIFPAGYHIICYSTTDKSQTYFQGIEGYRGFSCMTLSPMKRFLAVGGKADKPAIFIYDTMS